MASLLLIAFVFFVWLLWGATAILEKAVKNSGLPVEKRGGVSLFPIIPIFPLFFWGLAALIDRFYSPWGLQVVAGLHALYAIVLLVFIFRYSTRLIGLGK